MLKSLFSSKPGVLGHAAENLAVEMKSAAVRHLDIVGSRRLSA